MRVLVCGAGGFIGRHVVEGFARRGAEIAPADVFDTGQSGLIRLDDPTLTLGAIIQAVGPDAVINCAGAASVPKSFENPLWDFELNVGLVARLLDAIRHSAPFAKFVNLSSAAVYGEPALSPIPEDAPIRPVSPYGGHKAQAEALCREYAAIFGLKCLSLRVFSAYGPGLKKQLFWDFYQKGLASDRISMFGTGEETRDFVYVEDIVDAIAVTADMSDFNGGSINVASGRSVTIREAVQTFSQALGWRKEIQFSGEARAGDPVAWRADISALKALGFEPRFDLQKGLTKISSWLKDL